MLPNLVSHWLLGRQLSVSAELSRVGVGPRVGAHYDMRLRGIKEAVKACTLACGKVLNKL